MLYLNTKGNPNSNCVTIKKNHTIMILLKLSYSFNSRFSLAFFDFIVFRSLIHGEKKN